MTSLFSIAGIFSTLVDWFDAAIRWLFDVMLSVVSHILDVFLAFVATILDSSGALTMFTTAMNTLGSFFQIMNGWIPLDIAFMLIASYLSFVVAFLVFKFVLKLTPFVG
jgi:hypothetical protein